MQILISRFTKQILSFKFSRPGSSRACFNGGILMENIVNTLITCARGWLGYLEKKSNSQLDDFTANAGSGNYTCFARDYKRDTCLLYTSRCV